MQQINQPPSPPPVASQPLPSPQQALKSHRGGAVLTLGILGIALCFICGIGFICGVIAWVMGKNDLREMNAGTMDPAGRDLTNAGKICGMIGVILGCIGLALWLLWLLIWLGLGLAVFTGR